MKILIIQTAFIGDVVLATTLLESLHRAYPEAELHALVRKGNEGLLNEHPFLTKVWIWNKKEKWSSLWQLIRAFRKQHFDVVVNAQRFFSSGLMTVLSGGKSTIGFDKNPLSFLFSKRLPHRIGEGHEIDRNATLIQHIVSEQVLQPKLYPTTTDEQVVADLLSIYKKENPDFKYVCMAPTSVWFTKQWPPERWGMLMQAISEHIHVFLLGAKGDFELVTNIMNSYPRKNVDNLAGKLNFLQSAALMRHADMNYVNDSAPMHFASAMNAPVTAIFCSTIPDFGFGPRSDKSFIVQTNQDLSCRPCGLHGYKACPKGHFDCSKIEVEAFGLKTTNK
jgi:ADP-heptose:LPS heptosyltransferase